MKMIHGKRGMLMVIIMNLGKEIGKWRKMNEQE